MYFQAEAELYFSKKLWFLFACRKEALESALPKFHSIKRTDGFPNIWQFSQELYNKLWRALHVFSKPSVPLTLHSRSFQQAPNPLLHVWILSFPFCHFLWYFYKNLHRQQQLCEISVLCNFSAFFPQWSSLFFSVLYNIPAQGIWVVPSLEWTVNFKKGKFICWKLFFSQLWKPYCCHSTFKGKWSCLCILYTRVHPKTAWKTQVGLKSFFMWIHLNWKI